MSRPSSAGWRTMAGKPGTIFIIKICEMAMNETLILDLYTTFQHSAEC